MTAFRKNEKGVFESALVDAHDSLTSMNKTVNTGLRTPSVLVLADAKVEFLDSHMKTDEREEQAQELSKMALDIFTEALGKKRRISACETTKKTVSIQPEFVNHGAGRYSFIFVSLLQRTKPTTFWKKRVAS